MPEKKRPLSPHVGIYKWQVSNTLSILHRATGVALFVGALVLVAWIVSLALGQASYDRVLNVLRGPLGLLLLFGLSAAFFYHMGNGIRHLAWDAGYGFEKRLAQKTGWFTVLASIAFTILFWLGVNA
jgi:succinate dehydrogenase / fumarate reductase cytochrome b subunit